VNLITATYINMLKKLLERLERVKIVTETGCWESPYGCVAGYPRIYNPDDQKMYLLSRISAACHLGLDINDTTKFACHKNECNNTKCWNPEHLYIGNFLSNRKDAIEIGANRGNKNIGLARSKQQSSKTRCPRGHEYNKENTYRNTIGARICKECKRLRQIKYRKSHKV
jgi:hypothetical protein